MLPLTKLGYLIPALFALFIGIWIPGYSQVSLQTQQMTKAVVDVKGWNHDTVLEIHGDLQYYEGVLLRDVTSSSHMQYRRLPHLLNDENGQAYGVATYKFVIQNLQPDKYYGIQVTDISSAYRVVINGKEMMKNGVVSYLKDEHRPQWKEKIALFQSDSVGQAEVVIEVSNFSYFEGGIRNYLIIGEFERLQAYASHQRDVELFQFASLMILGLFFAGVYAVDREFTALLFFALLCIDNAIRTVVRGHRIVYDLIYPFSWDVAVRIEFLVGYLAFPFFGLFLYYMRYVKERRFIKWFYIATALFFTVITLFTPNEIYGNALKYYVILMELFMVYATWVLVQGVRQKRKDALVILLTSLFLFFGILYDYYVRGFTAMIPTAIYCMMIILTLIVTNVIRINVRNTKNLAQQLTHSLEQEKQLTEKLAALDQLKNEFLINTTHELRTPLNGMINITETIIQGFEGPLTKGQQENLQLVTASGKRLYHLINDLLDSIRLKHRDLHIDKKHMDIKKVMDPVIQVMEFSNDNPHVRIVNELQDDLYIYADENRFIQILYNILGNAMKYTKQGSIRITAQPVGQYIQIRIEDSGIGISQEQLQHLWDEYDIFASSFETDYNGMGIGLKITKDLVELQGGTITVESELQKGTVCTFTLPKGSRLKVEQSPLPKTEEMFVHIQKKQHSEHQKGHKILVVDDELVNRRALYNVLTSDNYYVLLATDGKEALELLAKHKDIKLVILDIMLPGISGYDICRKIRDLYSINDLPVLMMTAGLKEQSMALGFEAGTNDFLTKPFAVDELKARVKTLIMMKLNYDRAIANEIAFLQAQIKPHFLINVLNIVTYLTEEAPDKAEKLMHNLSIYLRNHFDFYNLESFIPLSKELETIEAYIQIEKERFGERIQYRCIMDDDIQLKIPPLILQPLVENAVRHGICKKIDGGHMTLQIEQLSDTVRFTVLDDGVGMDAQTLQAILDGKKSNSVAFKNITMRLKRTYGTTLHIKSEVDKGTKITFSIPWEVNGDV